MEIQSILIADTVPEFFLRELKQKQLDVQYMPDISQQTLREAISDASYLMIRGRHTIGKTELDNARKLKAILRPGSGIDNVDKDEVRQRGIQLITSPEGNSDAVGEHALGILLSLMRNTFAGFGNVLEEQWDRYSYIGEEMSGQTVGIIGYGNTGRAFAKRLSGFPCKVLAYDKYKRDYGDKYAGEVSLEEILNNATVLSFHVPLNSETHSYFNDDFLQQLAHPVWLINTSRGEVVDIPALQRGLQDAVVKGAGLDVLPEEHKSSERRKHVHTLTKWAGTGKVIITPHIAGLSHRSGEKIFTMLLEKLFDRYRFN